MSKGTPSVPLLALPDSAAVLEVVVLLVVLIVLVILIIVLVVLLIVVLAVLAVLAVVRIVGAVVVLVIVVIVVGHNISLLLIVSYRSSMSERLQNYPCSLRIF